MKVYRDIENDKVQLNDSIATIGFFDGVHLGHRKIISQLLKKSKEIKRESVIITLWPHPRLVLSNNYNERFLLTSLDEKIYILEKTGINNLIILPFTKELSQLNYKSFVQDIVIRKLHITNLIMGQNHHFGKNREGNYENLVKMRPEINIGIEKVESVLFNNNVVSSSLIRKYLQTGRIEEANSFLGYSFFCEGQVIQGEKIGRKIGFPTANINVIEKNKLFPYKGVYAVEIEIDGKVLYGMLNIGNRPTVHVQKTISVEVHIFDFEEDIYGKNLKVSFITRIRDEKKFKDINQLKLQLEQDKRDINGIFNNK